jgi:coenzyme F420-reducing hydrogenase delta subunit
VISTKLSADVDFEKIDNLLSLAKSNNSQGELEQAKDVLNEVAAEGKQIQKLLYEISEQNKILKAKQFVQRHAERISNLILQAKTFGLDQTAAELQQSQVQLLQANSTSQIKQQFKIIIIHQQKVAQVKEVSQAEILRLQSLLDPLEKEAKRLGNDLQGNNAASRLLNYTLDLIEQTKQDINDLEYVSGRIDTKNLDLTIGKNIQTIKDLLMKVEKLIYTSS